MLTTQQYRGADKGSRWHRYLTRLSIIRPVCFLLIYRAVYFSQGQWVMKGVLVALVFFIPLCVFAGADLRMTNVTDIRSMAPQGVTFKGSDNCQYYGNTRDRDHRNGILVTRRVCQGLSKPARARAYLIKLVRRDLPVPMVPAGSTWILKRIQKPAQ